MFFNRYPLVGSNPRKKNIISSARGSSKIGTLMISMFFVEYFSSRAKILSAIFLPDLLKVSSTDKSNNILIILIFAMYSSDRFSGEICPQIITFQERMDEAKLGLNWDQFRTSVQRP